MKALLFINGQPPKKAPKNLHQYNKIFCTDGAYNYLTEFDIVPDFLIGDLDSVIKEKINEKTEILLRPNQDFTDFDKALQEIELQGFTEVDVYGSTGLEQDHFLGNLSTALSFKERLKIVFFDDYSIFFFTDNQIKLNSVKNRVISLLPFPIATQVESSGLKFPLNNRDLQLGINVGTRNYATSETVEIQYNTGELLIFISRYTK